MFDWKHPDYLPVFADRARRLERLRAEPEVFPHLRRYYRENPIDFIRDWGITADPRNVEIGLPVMLPFLPFPRQVEWLEWVLERWRAREPGVTPKSRDMGISWLAIGLSCSLCCFHDDMAIGFGSRKLDLVDKLGDPKSLFWKARKFMEMLPREFTGGWRSKTHSSEGLIKFPTTGATIAGEGGDDIGRGARTSLYFVDETSAIPHGETIDAALSQTTNCRQDLSTPRGMLNTFADRVHRWPDRRVFRFHWRDDPRKDDAWYAKQQDELDPVIVAQEIDMDFAASVTGLLIPPLWVQSAIDVHLRLGIVPSGRRAAALDVADQGRDSNAMAVAYGILIERLDEWSGKGEDIFATTQRAFGICDDCELDGFLYDADGLGAGVRGDARVINEQRRERAAIDGNLRRLLTVEAFRGSGEVLNPGGQDVKGRLNSDYFANLKAQSWWTLRRRFEQTHRAATGQEYQPDMLISIPKDLPLRGKLVAELSQPTYSLNGVGKVLVDKAPDEARSPNLADSVMMLMGRHRQAMRISAEVREAARRGR